MTLSRNFFKKLGFPRYALLKKTGFNFLVEDMVAGERAGRLKADACIFDKREC